MARQGAAGFVARELVFRVLLAQAPGIRSNILLLRWHPPHERVRSFTQREQVWLHLEARQISDEIANLRFVQVTDDTVFVTAAAFGQKALCDRLGATVVHVRRV